jgi:hypothetical protein
VKAVLLIMLLCMLPAFVSSFRKACTIAEWGVAVVMAPVLVVAFVAMLAAVVTVLALAGHG